MALALSCSACGIHENEIVQISSLTYADGREAHFCLGCFVGGTVNDGAILLLGPAKVGKTSFCKAESKILRAMAPYVRMCPSKPQRAVEKAPQIAVGS